MAVYTLNAGDIAAYAKVLVAATVDTVQFAEAVSDVEITTDGTSAIYVTLDAVDPTVAGARTLLIPARAGTRTLRVGKREAPTTVKLISAATPTYSVAKPWAASPVGV